MDTYTIIAIVVVVLILIIIVLAYLYPEWFGLEEGQDETETYSMDPTMGLKKFESMEEDKPNTNKDVEVMPENYDWEEQIKDMNLDPSVMESHNEYTEELTRFSSGAGFGSVADDNRTVTDINWVGFHRPQYIPVDPTARQVPSEDVNIYKRNDTWGPLGASVFEQEL